MTTKIRQARKNSGMTAGKIAEQIGITRESLYRIESGISVPRRETARALYFFYKGKVPLAAIYDPLFKPGEKP